MTTVTHNNLHDAVAALAGRCDWAFTEDGQGFNKSDTGIGHFLAELPYEEWSEAQRYAAWQMLRKYKRQLAGIGIDYDAIAQPPRPRDDYGAEASETWARGVAQEERREEVYRRKIEEREAAERAQRILDVTAEGLLVARSPYNADVVAAQRGIPSRRWDGAQNTFNPAAPGCLEAVKAMAEEFGFTVTDAAAAILDGVSETKALATHRIELAEDSWRYAGKRPFVLTFPKNFDISSRIKKAEGWEWNSERVAWGLKAVPANVPTLRELTEGFGFQWSEEAKARLLYLKDDADRLERSTRELTEASRALDSDVEYEGVDRDLLGIVDGPLTLRGFQNAGVSYALKTRGCFIADDMGTGKALAADAKVLTPEGWRLMGDLAVGDRVIGSDGAATKVVGVYPQGVRQLYRVTFSDGSSVEADDDHLWAVRSAVQKGRDQGYMVKRQGDLGPLHDAAGNARWYVPMVEPVEFESDEDRPLDAYLLGALLGDGGIAHRVIFSSVDAECIAKVAAALPTGAGIVATGHGCDYRIVGAGTGRPNPVMDGLRELGLMGCRSETKFVPQRYLLAPPWHRMELLRGLLDTDGYVEPGHNTVEFVSVSRQLAEDVRFLVRSLGGRATINEKPTSGQLAYRVHIAMPKGMVPFALSRKVAAYAERTKYEPTRAIVSIEATRRAPAVCIKVDAEDELFVCEDFIVTHNTIQALIAAREADAFPLLVVVRASIKPKWRDEAKRWLPGRKVVVLSGTKPDIQDVDGADVIVINYDVLPAWAGMAGKDAVRRGKRQKDADKPGLLCRIGVKGLVVDESHYGKTPEAKRTRALVMVARQIRADHGDAGLVMNLSGTVVLNRPIELAAQLAIIGRLEDFGGYWGYAKRYCNAGPWGYNGAMDVSGSSNEEELHARLRGSCYIRRTKDQVLTDLPEKQIARLPIEIDNAREYREAELNVIKWVRDQVEADREFLAEIADLPEDEQKRRIATRKTEKEMRARQAEELVKLNALRRIAARGKLAAVKDWIEDFLESAENEKLVVFAHHRDIQAGLAEAFPGCLRIHAADDTDERYRNMRAFQNDPSKRLIVCSMEAAREGLDLYAASNALFVEFGWNVNIHRQAEDRIHRMGQTAGACTIWQAVGEGTIDQDMIALIEAKRHVTEAVTDGKVSDEKIVSGSIASETMKRLKARHA